MLSKQVNTFFWNVKNFNKGLVFNLALVRIFPIETLHTKNTSYKSQLVKKESCTIKNFI